MKLNLGAAKSAIPLGPIEKHGEVFVIREDLVFVGKANGTKAVSMYEMAKGEDGVVTGGSRESTQALMAAIICNDLGIGYEFHCPKGPDTDIKQTIRSFGFSIIEHNVGHRTVLNARARESAFKKGWLHIPTGCECQKMIDIIISRCKDMGDWPGDRLVIPIGSGMTMIGILSAIEKYGKRWKFGVLGVHVAANPPTKRIKKWLPQKLPFKLELVEAKSRLSSKVASEYDNVQVDPIYSGKCVPFLQKGDLLWNSGARQSSLRSISIAPNACKK